MKKAARHRRALVLLAVLTLSIRPEATAGETATQANKPARKAQEILREHCFSCHGQDPDNSEGSGLNILDHTMLVQRGVVVPKKPASSPMIRKIELGTMPPPDEGPPVPAEQIKLLRAWIEAGAAPFPNDRH
jgi:hypothetical protein